MNRRDLIKSALLIGGGLAANLSWSKDLRQVLSEKSDLTLLDEQSVLASVMETIIPETSTPGSKSLHLEQFAARMIKDCYSKKDQGLFKRGLSAADQAAQAAFQKSFTACSQTQRETVLNKMQTSSDQMQADFLKIIKALTIVGYHNCEYVMTNVHHYNMNPGFFNGCVPVSKS